MKTKELLNQMTDIYRCSKNSNRPMFSTTLFDFFTKLTNKNKSKVEYVRELNKTDESKAKEYKQNELIGCTISATFDKQRLAYCVKEKTGIISIDIDKDKNPGLNVEEAKQKVIQLPYVFLSMLSCRGEGIFCLVYYNKEKSIKNVFNALKEDFMKFGYLIDDCSDITRLRIISYDSLILYKENVEIYDKELIIEREPYECSKDWGLTKEDLKDITYAIYVLVNYCNYKSDKYEDWLLDGFRLATIPNKEIGLKLFTMISEKSDNYKGPKDVEEKFNNCYKTTEYKTNILGYYINKIKEIYGPEWRYRINDLLKTTRFYFPKSSK